jgi:hypothetical protein
MMPNDGRIDGSKTTFLDQNETSIIHNGVEALPSLSEGGDVYGSDNNVRSRARIGRFANSEISREAERTGRVFSPPCIAKQEEGTLTQYVSDGH